MTLTITAPRGLNQAKCDEAFAVFRKNPPLLFKHATDLALDIRRADYLSKPEPNTRRKARFIGPHIILQKMVDGKVFDYIAKQKTRHIGSSDQVQIEDFFRQGNIMGALHFISKKSKRKIDKLVEEFSLFKPNNSFYQEDPEFMQNLKQRISNGIENMMDRFFEITACSFSVGANKYGGCSNPVESIRALLNNNVRFFNSIAKLRFDIFNQLSRFLIRAAKDDGEPTLRKHWQIHSFNKGEGTVDMIAPTDALFKELIESYPYDDTAAIFAEGSADGNSCPSFGCPARKVNFPNGLGTMIDVFYRWYLKTLDDHFFIPLKQLSIHSK